MVKCGKKNCNEPKLYISFKNGSKILSEFCIKHKQVVLRIPKHGNLVIGYEDNEDENL